MAGTLGSGHVDFHPDRPIIHFASTPQQVAHALLTQKLRETGFETAEEVPR